MDTDYLRARRERERQEALKRVRCNYRRLSTGWKYTVLSAEEREAARVLTRTARFYIYRRREKARRDAQRSRDAVHCVIRTLRRCVLKKQGMQLLADEKIIKVKRERRDSASRLITRAFRIMLSRRTLEHNKAALLLTCVWRGFSSRRIARYRRQELHEAATCIARAWRLYLTHCRGLRFYRCLHLFARLAKGHIEKRRHRQHIRKTASTKISRLVRTHLNRLRAERERKVLAALLLTNFVKAIFAQRRLKERIKTRTIKKRKCVLMAAYFSSVYFRILSQRFVQQKIRRVAGLRLTHFARIALIRIQRRKRERRRLAAFLALTLQRFWRGRIGRARFRTFRNESYKCRRCGGMEFGGFYCKRCGFCRYEQHKGPKYLARSSPYNSNSRPGIVKRLRARCATTKIKKQQAKNLLLRKKLSQIPSPRPIGPQTDLDLARETERLVALSKSIVAAGVGPQARSRL